MDATMIATLFGLNSQLADKRGFPTAGRRHAFAIASRMGRSNTSSKSLAAGLNS